MIKRSNALKKLVCAALCSVIVAAMGTAPSLGAAASAEDGQSSAASSGSLNGENISEKDSNIKKYNNSKAKSYYSNNCENYSKHTI